MDLISRKAAIDALEFERDCLDGVEDAIEIIQQLPSINAVPLDKLCEWLQENASLTHGTLISAAGWKYELTRWMEGLDAAD